MEHDFYIEDKDVIFYVKGNSISRSEQETNETASIADSELAIKTVILNPTKELYDIFRFLTTFEIFFINHLIDFDEQGHIKPKNKDIIYYSYNGAYSLNPEILAAKMITSIRHLNSSVINPKNKFLKILSSLEPHQEYFIKKELKKK